VPWDDPFLDSALDENLGRDCNETLGAAKRLTMREWDEGEQRQQGRSSESIPAKRLTAPYILCKGFREGVNGWR
jgi:hypothetical protein